MSDSYPGSSQRRNQKLKSRSPKLSTESNRHEYVFRFQGIVLLILILLLYTLPLEYLQKACHTPYIHRSACVKCGIAGMLGLRQVVQDSITVFRSTILLLNIHYLPVKYVLYQLEYSSILGQYGSSTLYYYSTE